MITKNTNDTKNLLNPPLDPCYTISRKEEREYLALWQSLTITDDFMFGKIMQDPEICMELLQIIFPHQQIERIEYINTQETLRPDKDAKGIRLDVFVRDNQNVAFCVEMQTRNEDVLPKRSRYYQSLVDLELLDRGQSYGHLSPSYIIFICSFDLFQRGFHIYEFMNYCTQDRDMELGDEATKIFLNARGKADDISPRLKEFLDYVAGKEHDTPSPFIDKLKHALSCAKQDRHLRRQHMSLFFREMDIRADALKEGREIERAELVLSMLKNGVDREMIRKITGLSDDKLDRIITDSK